MTKQDPLDDFDDEEKASSLPVNTKSTTSTGKKLLREGLTLAEEKALAEAYKLFFLPYRIKDTNLEEDMIGEEEYRHLSTDGPMISVQTLRIHP